MPATADDRIAGLSTSVAVKAPVHTVATSNITLSGLQTINGVTLDGSTLYRVLCINQTDTTQNGIYNATTGSWSRAQDFDGNRDVVQGTRVLVALPGSSNAQEYELTSANPITFGTSAITFALRYGANATYDVSPAETAALVTIVNKNYRWGHAYRYGTNTTPGTTDMTSALNASLAQSYQANGASPYWPEDTYLVSSLTITGATKIRTDGIGTILKQKSGQASDTHIINIQSSDVEIGTFSAIGNISTDTGEFMHVVVVGGSASYSRITLGDITATNIRGDILYLGGTAANPIYDVKVGNLYGTNIYRNVLSIIGCEGYDIESVGGTQIGYRTYDVEPNVGSQTNTSGIIRSVRGANFQYAGANVTLGANEIGVAYLDNNLLANSSPGYPTHPSSAGNIGIIVSNCSSLKIRSLVAANFLERLYNSNANTVNCSTVIEYASISNCDTTEAVYKTVFNLDAFVTLEIKSGSAAMTAVDRYLVKHATNGVHRLRNMAISGGPVAATANHCEYENIALNASGLASNLFSSISNSIFKNVVCTNDASATLQLNCQDNVWINSSGAPTNFVNSGTNHIVIKSTFNSVSYDYAMLPAGTISWGQSGTSPIITNGSTINTNGLSVTRVSPGGAVTAIVLQAGTRPGQECTVINESAAANTITFAAAGTSNVADGVTTVIAGLRCAKYTWSSATNLWYHS